MFKKLMLSVAMLVFFAGQALADTMPAMEKIAVFRIGSNSVIVDDQEYQMDVPPFIENGRAFVPVRFLGATLGATNIVWDNGEVNITFPDKSVVLKINKPWLNDNGQYELMDVTPLLRSDRVFLPARYVAEAAGGRVDWDEASQSVLVKR